MSEDNDKLVGVEVICPKCEIKNYFWFRSGKQLISEFVDDLKLIRNAIDYYDAIGEVIKKWEERLK